VILLLRLVKTMASQSENDSSLQDNNRAGATETQLETASSGGRDRASFVGKIKSMARRASTVFIPGAAISDPMKAVEEEKTQGGHFVPGFGHKGLGLAARGRRLETTDQERTVAALKAEATEKLFELRGKDTRIMEAEKRVVDSTPWNRAESGIVNIAEEKKKKLEETKTGILKTIVDMIIPEAFPDVPLAGHDEIVRAKIKQATSSATGRKLLGFIAGVDTALRETDPEWIKAENNRKQAEMEATEKALVAERHAAMSKKQSSFEIARKSVAKFFSLGPEKNIRKRPDGHAPKQTLDEKILQVKLDTIRAEQAEGAAYHDEQERILKQVIHEYTHNPEKGKRVKSLPPHHMGSEEHLADFDRHFLLHEKGVALTPFEEAIPGMEELMKEQPGLFVIQEEPKEEEEYNQGYDYDGHAAKVQAKHAKELAEREHKYFGKDIESVAAASEARSGLTPLPETAQQKASLLKRREKAIQRMYQDANIPNPWRDSEAFEVFKPSFTERDLTAEEVKAKFDHKNYVPGYFSQYRGETKIFGFPQVADQNNLTEKLRSEKEKKKQKNLKKGEMEYNYTPGHDNNEATNTGARYTWDPKTEKYVVPATNKFKDNNPRLEVFKPATTDVAADAIYKYRKFEHRVFPQSSILPSKADLLADRAKRAASDAKLWKPFVRFKKSHVDFSRDPVRINTNDAINIRKVKKKLFKQLQCGALNRLDYDNALAALAAGNTDATAANGVAVPDNYGDYPDDEYYSDESSFGDEDDEKSLGVDESVTIGANANHGSQDFSSAVHLQGSPATVGVHNSGFLSPPGAFPGAGGGSIGGGGGESVAEGGSITGGASILGGSIEGSQYTKSTRRSQRERRKKEAVAKNQQYTGITSSIMAPMIPMRVLLTMGTGGKYADRTSVDHSVLQGKAGSINAGVTNEIQTDRPNRGHVLRPVKAAKDPLLELDKKDAKVDNELYLNEIDKTFNTLKKQLIDSANDNNLELTDQQVQAVGDLYKGETRTMVAQRQLLEEDSLPSARQLVRVKMTRHRGVLKLDNKHLSRHNQSTREWGLESAKTSEKRREQVHSKKLLKIKMASVKKTMDDMKVVEEKAAIERERERNRAGC